MGLTFKKLAIFYFFNAYINVNVQFVTERSTVQKWDFANINYRDVDWIQLAQVVQNGEFY